MSDQTAIALKRAVEAVQIPSGNQINLPAETLVILTQQLGDSYTVYVVHQAGLFRIRGDDGDALGLEKISTVVAGAEFSEEAVWAQLRECYDPEIPVNIVDLGLIYGLQVTDDPQGKKSVTIQMTLTAPGCGMGPTLARDAEQRILSLPGVGNANVELVWDPPWVPERISAAGKEKLGMV
jgi:probable FeS assembly SUF system protein SufT